MEKSVVEQEREIKDLIRRGIRWADKTGSLRKDCLRRLIDLTHSPHSSLKCFAATNIQFFFKDFPELEEAAINAVYDLCEDQDPQVRMHGYAAITAVSKEQKKWVKRNADVLVQLLQSDEPDEVRVVKKALIEHLDLDPRATLGVLCDQITPPDPATVDEEEREVRGRLSRLVLSFITKDAKRAILERHAHAQGGSVETILIDGLTSALPNLTDEEVELIIRDILLLLPRYKPPPATSRTSLSQNPDDYSQHCISLLNGLFERIKLILKLNLPAPPPSATPVTTFDRAFALLGFVRTLVLKERIVPFQQLLNFYLELLGDPDIVKDKIPSQDLGLLVTNCGEVMELWEGTKPVSTQPMKQKVMEIMPLVLQPLVDSQLAPKHAWAACKFLLKTWNECSTMYPQLGWAKPSNLASTLKQIQSMPKPTNNGDQEPDVYPEVQTLVKELLAPRSSQKPPTETTSVVSKAPVKTNTRPAIRRPNGLPEKPATDSELIPLKRALNGQVELQIRGASDNKGKGRSASSSDSANDPPTSQRPAKRRKGEAEEDAPISSPSLLSRLGISADETRQRSTQMEVDRGGGQGLSIRGAASKGLGGSGPSSSSASSLLERLGDSGGRNRGRRN